MRHRQGRSDTLIVGVKYCGGCRAGYDRVAAVDSLKARLPGVVEFVAPGDADASLILVVTGCRAACARVDSADGRPLEYITSPEDAERWAAEILKYYA